MKFLYTILVFLIDKINELGNILYNVSKYLLINIVCCLSVFVLFVGVGYLSSLFDGFVWWSGMSSYDTGWWYDKLIIYFARGGAVLVTFIFCGCAFALTLWAIKMLLTDVLIGGTTQLIYGIMVACESGWKKAKRKSELKFSPYRGRY